jgi:thiamine biosynthesis lipoprotein
VTNFEHIELAMGTGFRFQGSTALDTTELNAAIAAACLELHEADRIFSLYKPESPLSQLAAGKTSVAKLPSVVSEMWDECERYEKLTDGWFSAFTPQHTFDPSGLVKSWAALRACDILTEAGLTDFTLNAGGDVQISASNNDAELWKVGITKPVSVASEESGALVVVDLSGTGFCGVATSGSVERGSHIWNPKNPDQDPATVLTQITVIASNIVEADVWATAAFAEGLNAFKRIDELENVEALGILADGQIAATPGFQALIAR